MSHDQTVAVGGVIALAGVAFVTLPARRLVSADRRAAPAPDSLAGTQR